MSSTASGSRRSRQARSAAPSSFIYHIIRHRLAVIRRRTQFLLLKARQRKHTVEGLLLAHANIDEVIRVIRGAAGEAVERYNAVYRETISDGEFSVEVEGLHPNGPNHKLKIFSMKLLLIMLCLF